MEAGTNSSYCKRNGPTFDMPKPDEETCDRRPAHSFRVVNEGVFFISIADINQVLNTVRFLWSVTLRKGEEGSSWLSYGEIKLQNSIFKDTYKFFLQPFHNGSYLIISDALGLFTIPHRDFLLLRKRHLTAASN